MNCIECNSNTIYNKKRGLINMKGDTMKHLLAIVIIFFLLCLAVGCAVERTAYKWQPTEIKNSQVPDLVNALQADEIAKWRKTGTLPGGKCAKWASAEYQKLRADNKEPWIIIGWTEPWVTADGIYLGSNGTQSYYRPFPKAKTFELHVMTGYYKDGRLVVADGDINKPGLITGAGGYWSYQLTNGFFPICIFNEVETKAFADRYEK